MECINLPKYIQYLFWGTMALLLWASCSESDKTQAAEVKLLRKELELSQRETALAEKELNLLKRQALPPADSIRAKAPVLKPAAPKLPVPAPARPTPKPAPQPVKVPKLPPNDTVFHYYTNRRVSVKVFPWKDGKRAVVLYDPAGKPVYDLEEINLSYSNSVYLSFAPNGSVAKAHSSFNPGASMYWYETDITFDTDNSPLWKQETRMPMHALNDEWNSTWLWDKPKHEWIRQQSMQCQPLPVTPKPKP